MGPKNPCAISCTEAACFKGGGVDVDRWDEKAFTLIDPQKLVGGASTPADPLPHQPLARGVHPNQQFAVSNCQRDHHGNRRA